VAAVSPPKRKLPYEAELEAMLARHRAEIDALAERFRSEYVVPNAISSMAKMKNMLHTSRTRVQPLTTIGSVVKPLYWATQAMILNSDSVM
jgi:hypothetical protein